MLIGVDSWFPADQFAIDNLKLLSGFKFWNWYCGGAGLYLQTPWPKTNVKLLFDNGVLGIPIWVPRQNCSEPPQTNAQQAVEAANSYVLNPLVNGKPSLALDCEASMGSILGFQDWIDAWCTEVAALNYQPITYAGSHHVGIKSLAWNVAWGEHSLVPAPSEMLQYGPYELRTPQGQNIMEVDADGCADNFFVTPPPPPGPIERLINVQLMQIQQGDNGYPVQSLQALLNHYENANLHVDGVFGPLTHNAVISFQRNHKLSADGIVGVHTWGDLVGVPQ